LLLGWLILQAVDVEKYSGSVDFCKHTKTYGGPNKFFPLNSARHTELLRGFVKYCIDHKASMSAGLKNPLASTLQSWHVVK
jgi:hypothetical protein